MGRVIGIFTSKLQLSMPVKMFQWRGGQGGTEYFCEFDNLYLYGDSANLTGGYGIYTSRIDGCDLVDTRITRCYIDEFRDDAVTISSTWGWVISNAVIEHNRGYCIYALGGGELTISDCKLSGNRNNKKIAAVYLSSTNNLITNTQFERNGTDGLHLNRACDNGTVISNCTFIGNSEDSVDVSSDIYIYSNKGVLISNCFFDGECKAKHGVFVDSLADDVLIRGCKFMNHSSSHISDDYNKAIYTEQYYDTHMAVLVENDNYVHSAISGTGTEQEITEQITNPDVPRNITVTTDSSNGIITVWGIDAHGRFCSEVIEISASGTVQGMIAFATIDKITISKKINTTEAVEIGIGCKIGLSNTINEADDVFKVKKNNADIASYYVDTTYNTVEFHTIENGDELTIYYKSNLNIYD